MPPAGGRRKATEEAHWFIQFWPQTAHHVCGRYTGQNRSMATTRHRAAGGGFSSTGFFPASPPRHTREARTLVDTWPPPHTSAYHPSSNHLRYGTDSASVQREDTSLPRPSRQNPSGFSTGTCRKFTGGKTMERSPQNSEGTGRQALHAGRRGDAADLCALRRLASRVLSGRYWRARH